MLSRAATPNEQLHASLLSLAAREASDADDVDDDVEIVYFDDDGRGGAKITPPIKNVPWELSQK